MDSNRGGASATNSPRYVPVDMAILDITDFNETDEPLATYAEIGDKLGIDASAIAKIVRRLRIEPYTIKEPRHYSSALNADQVRRVVEYRKRYGAVLRKNKLEL